MRSRGGCSLGVITSQKQFAQATGAAYDPDMPPEATTLRGRNRRRIALGLLCAGVFYLLSIGPVAKWDADHGPAANAIYTPLGMVAEIPGMKVFFRWYIFRVWKVDTMGDNTL